MCEVFCERYEQGVPMFWLEALHQVLGPWQNVQGLQKRACVERQKTDPMPDAAQEITAGFLTEPLLLV